MSRFIDPVDVIQESHRTYVHQSVQFASEIYNTSDELIVDPRTDAQVTVKFRKNATYIVFRGSESTRDWTMNILFRFRFVNVLNTSTRVRAHSGFVYQWRGVRSRVINLLNKYHDNALPIICSGHSLGGAVATIATLDLNEMLYNVILVSFGSPRALNWYGKNAFTNIVAYRCTNGSDIVTMLPILSLYHVGTHISCNTKKRRWVPSIRDHSIKTYLQQFKCDSSDEHEFV